MKYFCAIISELEHLSYFKSETLSKQLHENNRIVQEIFLLFNSDNEDKDDSIIHISSTPAQPINRPVYINYKP
ncbi:unnamed protein product, partial [Rotaria magnacalcarata]